MQSDYASGGLDTAYSGGQGAFAASYGSQAGYPPNLGAAGQDAYTANALYSQGFATGSQVCLFFRPRQTHTPLLVCTHACDNCRSACVCCWYSDLVTQLSRIVKATWTLLLANLEYPHFSITRAAAGLCHC